jgi:anaerobic magnesium-protoporphyrin IX monomethyl ester cyclase
VDALSKLGIRDIEVLDDIFNFDMDRAKVILKSMGKLSPGVKLSFPNGVRADRLDEELLDLMKVANTKYLVIAVESGSPRIQKFIRKNVNLEKAMEMINLSVSKKIYTSGFFMLGFPTETADEAGETVDFALKSKLHAAHFFGVTAFKGTTLESEYVRGAPGDAENFREYDYYRGSFNLSKIPDRQFAMLKSLAFLKFFLSKARFLRTIWRIPAKGRLMMHIYIFIVEKLVSLKRD